MCIIAVVGAAPVQVFLVRRKPDYIARSNLLDGSAVALRPPKPRCNNQRLTEWMRMPGRAGTRLEANACATDTRRSRRLESGIDSDATCEPVCRSKRQSARTHFSCRCDLGACFCRANPPANVHNMSVALAMASNQNGALLFL